MFRDGKKHSPAGSSERRQDKSRAEFDQFADGYTSGLDCHYKQLIGVRAEAFIEVKAMWLLHDLRRHPLELNHAPADLRILDFGCGTGLFLKVLTRYGLYGKFHGCDISRNMLDEAVKTWNERQMPQFDLMEGGKTPYTDGLFDLIIACAVFHHIPPRERLAACHEIARVLKPEGRLYVFEHNPYNPVTNWVVKRTPIDRNAVLLTAREMSHLVHAAGLRDIRSDYFLFFPPNWQWTQPLDRALRWLPLGGQWVAVAEHRKF